MQSCRHLELDGDTLCFTPWSCSPPSFCLVPPIRVRSVPPSLAVSTRFIFILGMARARRSKNSCQLVMSLVVFALLHQPCDWLKHQPGTHTLRDSEGPTYASDTRLAASELANYV